MSRYKSVKKISKIIYENFSRPGLHGNTTNKNIQYIPHNINFLEKHLIF